MPLHGFSWFCASPSSEGSLPSWFWGVAQCGGAGKAREGCAGGLGPEGFGLGLLV